MKVELMSIQNVLNISKNIWVSEVAIISSWQEYF